MPCSTPRYLVPFHPKRIPHHFVDVLVIGGGIAGLRAAMEIDPRLSLLVITKDTMEQSSSAYAQGGIAGVIDPEDRFEDHVTDTMVAGANLCDREVVEMVVREAPEHIQQLIAWGTQFDVEGGQLLLGREGGHSHRRIVHALGDATGHEVMRAMIDRAKTELGAGAVGQGVAIAAGHGRIGRLAIKLPGAARAEDRLLGPDEGLAMIGVPDQRAAAIAVVRE